MKKFLGVLLVLALLGGVSYFYLRAQWAPTGQTGTIYIPKGTSVDGVAQMLKKSGLIQSTWSFKILVRLQGAATGIQTGEYQFPVGLSAQEILAKILRGERVIHRLTIPEGYNFQQIAQAIGETGIATPQEVLAAFQDPKYLSLLGFPASSLEGYLFPSTYQYDRGTDLAKLLTRMIRTFQRNFDGELRQRAQETGWTLPQVVTLASIIEKETGQASERPLIASVFHNRLQRGMKLQSDPTIIYGIEDFDGNIRKKDILADHPYNTYVQFGLPPGPIASPGKASLRAVLYPAQSEYLFFVAKGDGSHQFSKDLEEHNRAVRRYQLGR